VAALPVETSSPRLFAQLIPSNHGSDNLLYAIATDGSGWQLTASGWFKLEPLPNA
jgi:hypothetical protein